MPNSASVFDSWALLALLQDERAAPQVEVLINRLHAQQGRLLISVVNLGEVWYSLARSRSEVDAAEGVAVITRLGFQVVPIDWNLAYQAAQFKAKYRLAYADCFAAALARLEGLALVTGDREFKALEREIKLHWL